MKTFLVVLLAFTMIFSAAIIVAAEGNSGDLYFDLGVSGSSSNDMNVTGQGKQTFDYKGVSGYLLGGEYDFGKFLVVAEYTNNSFENTEAAGFLTKSIPNGSSMFDYSSSTTLVRGGYYFINNDKLKFNGILGYMGLTVTQKDSSQKAFNLTNGGPLLGLDATYKFSDKFSLNAAYATTVGATSSVDALDDVNNPTTIPGKIKANYKVTPSITKSSNLTTYRIKGLYYWKQNLGMYLSYSSLTSKLNYSYSFLGTKVDADVDSSWNGWALGMDYKF